MNKHRNAVSGASAAFAFAVVLAVASSPGPVGATHEGGAPHEEPSVHGGHKMNSPAPATEDAAKPRNEVTAAYEAVTEKMHKDMAIPYTGDVDVDFVRGMIPHHQGAIDQANVLLEHSKDLRLRRLAMGIIAAQKKEINFMRNWLKEREQAGKKE